RTLHVLAAGLWFGTAVFFTFVVGLSLFGSFEAEAQKAERPAWFPPAAGWKVDRDPPSDKFPKPLIKEQGTRAAGFAGGPMFPWLCGIEVVCGGVALVTALGWSRARFPQKVHKVRTLVVALALVGAVAGWLLERRVADLQGPRDEKTEVVLKTDKPTSAQIE